jgi:hypothetical protein
MKALKVLTMRRERRQVVYQVKVLRQLLQVLVAPGERFMIIP